MTRTFQPLSWISLSLLSLSLMCGGPLSSWAAETDQESPVGGVGGAVHADPFTGTATTSIPIEVPSGRGGVQPNLALVYGSSNGNGWIGQGWKLEKGVIERQTKFGVDYSGDDYVFRLSGINVELVNIGNDEYRAKMEGGFNRIKKMISSSDNRPYFEVTDKTGKTFIFGTEEATRVAHPNNADHIYRWCLERVEDVHGNYMTLSYTNDQGQAYLTQIDYTGNDAGGLSPTNHVKFYLEDQPNASPMYGSNFFMKTAKRLKTIEVKANGSVVRAYGLTYTSSGLTNHSLLSSAQQFGNDASVNAAGTISAPSGSLPPMSFSYSEDSLAFSTSQSGPSFYITTALAGIDLNRVLPGDFNGDGQTDILRLSGWGSTTTDMYLSQGDGTFTAALAGPSLWVGNTDWAANIDLARIQLGDFNGDGKTDVMRLSGWGSTTTDIYLSQGDGTFTAAMAGPSLWVGWNAADAGVDLKRIKLGDFNGDGQTDILRLSGWGFTTTDMYLSQGDGTFAAAVAGPSLFVGGTHPAADIDMKRIQLGDFNGDGRTDIARLSGWNSGNTDIYLSQDDGTFTTAISGPNLVVWSSGNIGLYFPNDLLRIKLGDFNGDGQTDIFRLSGNLSSETDLYLSQGDGTFTPAMVGPNLLINDYFSSPIDFARVRVADFNGDGLTDILRLSGSNSADTDLYVSLGDGTFAGPVAGPSMWVGFDLVTASNDVARIKLGDFNGDGKMDISRLPGSDSTPPTEIMMESKAPTNLLVGVSNGLGATTTIAYQSSTSYLNTQLPFPLQTVHHITTNDGNGHVATTTYDYAHGFHHLGEREFRGFQYVKTTGSVGNTNEQTITETWFHQGNNPNVDVNDPHVLDAYLKGAPYRVKVTDGIGQVYAETTTTYAADDNEQAPFFTPPKIVVTTICDGNSCGKTTRTTLTYDTYGNITREDQEGETSTSADDRTVIRHFSPNPTAWIVGLPDTETIYEGLGNGNQVARTEWFYDGPNSCNAPSGSPTPSKGNLTRVVTWLNGGTSPETGIGYDAYGNVICTRDARGHTTTMTYDSSQTFATSVTNALNHSTTTTYYGINGVAQDTGLYGQVKTDTDPNNATTTTRYDVFGRRTHVMQPNGLSTTTYYNGFGTVGQQHVQTVTTEGLSTWTNFDGLGRTFKTRSTGTDSQFVVSEIHYDNRGAVTQQSLPYFENGGTPQWTTFAYDPLGRTTNTTNPDGSRVLACYDDWVTVGIDANNHRHRSVRDAYGRVVTVQEYAGTHTTCETSVDSPYSTTTYAYDVLGNLKTLTDAKGNVSTMTYDTLSRKTAMHDPDMGNWTYAYDAAGNLIQQTDAKSQMISFQYDALNRRVQKDYGAPQPIGQGNVNYVYDGSTHFRIGRLQQMLDGAGITTFYYDAMGQVTRTDRAVSGTTYTTQSTFDGFGRVLTLTYPDTSLIMHTYNGPQLQTVKEGSTTYASYGGFNSQGQPSTLTLGNGVTTTYTYDPNTYRLKTLKTVKDSTTLQDLGYTFDFGGNVIGLTDTQHGNQAFTYDDLDRLTSATDPSGTLTYTYDDIGNMLSNSRVSPSTYTYPTNSVRPHAVSTAGGHSYTYDANGNMINGAGRTISYDYENRPVSISKNGTTTTFVYDGDGGRVKKTVGSYTTTYIGQQYVCDQGVCAKMIFANGQRVAMKQATGTVDYFHPDHLGSTSVVTNTTGGAEQELTYYPYGETRVNTGGSSVTVDEWKLEVGTFAGGNDLYQSSGLGQQTSATVSNLPTDGSQVYVTLSYKVGGVWDHDDYVYTASGGSLTYPPPLSAPASGTTLTTSTVTFDGAHTATDVLHSMWVGTTAGTNNLHYGPVTNHSQTVTGLPSSGTIYVRYWSTNGGPSNDPNSWAFTDHTFTMNVGGGPPPTHALTVVSGGSGTGTITSVPTGINCGSACTVTYDENTSITLTATPTSGDLFAGWSGGGCSGTGLCILTLTQAETVTATFTSGSSSSFPPPLAAPTPSTTLTTSTVTFVGAHTATDVLHSMWVGTTAGTNNLHYGPVTNHSQTVSGLPSTGTIYVRYWSTNGGASNDPNSWFFTEHTYTMNVGGSAALTTQPPTIHLAAMSHVETESSTIHRLNWEQPASTSIVRVGGGAMGLRFAFQQEPVASTDSLVHLVSHSSASSTTISPVGGSLLTGSTVTFSWSYAGGGSSGPDVAYKYTGKERDTSTDLYFYEARYYDAALGRFISADTIVPNPNDPQALNRYAYTYNNPLRYTDPTGNTPYGCCRDYTPPSYDFSSYESSSYSTSTYTNSASYLNYSATSNYNATSISGTGFSSLGSNLAFVATVGSSQGLSAAASIGTDSSGRGLTVEDTYGALLPGGGLLVGTVRAGAATAFGKAFGKVVAAFKSFFGFGAKNIGNTVKSILLPGGKPIGQAGSDDAIREITGSLSDAQKLFQQISQGGAIISNRTYPGTLIKLPNGGTIGLRTTSTRSPGTTATIDVNIPNIPIKKIKINP